MTGQVMLPNVLRDIHRLRRHLRDLRAEIERFPRVLKAHQAKIAKQEQAVKDAHDAVKHQKVSNADKELSLKQTSQLLAKYEKQLSDMSTPKEIEAKQKEIASSKATIQHLEEQILAGMAKLDELTAKVPEQESAFKKAKAEFATFEKESKERNERLARELKLAEDQLKKQETLLPATMRGTYDRLVKAHGADALAEVVKNSCGHCHITVTIQNVNELNQGRLLFCSSCGRVLYPVE